MLLETKMNRKAQTFKILNMSIWRLIFLTILFFTIRQFATAKIQETIDVNDLKADILENRLFYSGAITSFDYETGRVHPEIIDFNKFNQPESLEDAFNYSNNKVAAMLELRNLETGNATTLYLNKKWYDRWEPLTTFKDYTQEY